MSFNDNDLNQERLYNNADCFSISFDNSWKELNLNARKRELSTEDKVKIVLEKIKEHPFLKDNPKAANEIANFRIKLLDLK